MIIADAKGNGKVKRRQNNFGAYLEKRVDIAERLKI